jgi:hypothetical protein
MTTNRDDRSDGDGGTTTTTVAILVAVVASTATPPPPLRARVTTPHGPSTSTPRPTPFRCGRVLGGDQRPTASPTGHAGWCFPLRPSSAAGGPNLRAAPGASALQRRGHLTAFLHTRLAQPSRHPWRLRLRRHGHPTAFIRSRSTQPSRRPWRLRLWRRGHCGRALGTSCRWPTPSTP